LKNQKKGFLIQSTDETVLINFFKRSLEEAIDSKIKQAASVLAEKELIIFLGNATSKSIAEFGALHFTSFVCLANHVPFPYLHPTIELSKEFAEKIAVIVLSVSGESKRVVNNLKRFLENGVTTISITNSEKSPVAMMSDINISYYISKEQNKGADLTSQIPALFIIEKLAKLVHAKKRGQ
jgi:DNA-binding MurR/RpiR family transcriptional regulator